MKRLLIFTIASAFLTIGACKKDKIEAPTEEDAQFTYTTSSESDNILIFTASNAELIAQWTFGNGSTGEGTTVEAQYPLAGNYEVTLAVFNEEGQASSSQTITIAQDDPSLLDDPLYNLLTGGIDIGSKTWVMDSLIDGHFGVGPNPVGAGGLYPEWWEALCSEKPNTGLYSDRYTFTLQGFGFDMATNGLVYIDDLQESNFPGAYENLGDYSAPYEDQLGETWKIEVGDDTMLTVSGGFLGFYTGTTEYQIIKLTENELFLRYLDASESVNSWYIRLTPVDADNGTDCETGGGGGNTYSLPIDFETIEPEFSVFGGSSDTIIDNPDQSGINTSNRVLETVHGDQTWAGLFVDITDPFDFSTNTTITLKVWAPSTGTMRVKLEAQASSTTFVEKDVEVTAANEWVEVSIDFAGEAADTYDRLVLFPGWDVANAGTFYLDDISQQ
ncbi:MAG: PKD domain-containing protein [Flavobacteriales bacterium]|nr:PKD domain-containing protein [Flavobacteriales bacterium]